MSSKTAKYVAWTQIDCLLISFFRFLHLILDENFPPQMNLEASNKALLDLQENYRVAILALKEKEVIISKLLQSGTATEILWTQNHLSFCKFLH